MVTTSSTLSPTRAKRGKLKRTPTVQVEASASNPDFNPRGSILRSRAGTTEPALASLPSTAGKLSLLQQRVARTPQVPPVTTPNLGATTAVVGASEGDSDTAMPAFVQLARRSLALGTALPVFHGSELPYVSVGQRIQLQLTSAMPHQEPSRQLDACATTQAALQAVQTQLVQPEFHATLATERDYARLYAPIQQGSQLLVWREPARALSINLAPFPYMHAQNQRVQRLFAQVGGRFNEHLTSLILLSKGQQLEQDLHNWVAQEYASLEALQSYRQLSSPTVVNYIHNWARVLNPGKDTPSYIATTPQGLTLAAQAGLVRTQLLAQVRGSHLCALPEPQLTPSDTGEPGAPARAGLPAVVGGLQSDMYLDAQLTMLHYRARSYHPQPLGGAPMPRVSFELSREMLQRYEFLLRMPRGMLALRAQQFLDREVHEQDKNYAYFLGSTLRLANRRMLEVAEHSVLTRALIARVQANMTYRISTNQLDDIVANGMTYRNYIASVFQIDDVDLQQGGTREPLEIVFDDGQLGITKDVDAQLYQQELARLKAQAVSASSAGEATEKKTIELPSSYSLKGAPTARTTSVKGVATRDASSATQEAPRNHEIAGSPQAQAFDSLEIGLLEHGNAWKLSREQLAELGVSIPQELEPVYQTARAQHEWEQRVASFQQDVAQAVDVALQASQAREHTREAWNTQTRLEQQASRAWNPLARASFAEQTRATSFAALDLYRADGKDVAIHNPTSDGEIASQSEEATTLDEASSPYLPDLYRNLESVALAVPAVARHWLVPRATWLGTYSTQVLTQLSYLRQAAHQLQASWEQECQHQVQRELEHEGALHATIASPSAVSGSQAEFEAQLTNQVLGEWLGTGAAPANARHLRADLSQQVAPEIILNRGNSRSTPDSRARAETTPASPRSELQDSSTEASATQEQSSLGSQQVPDELVSSTSEVAPSWKPHSEREVRLAVRAAAWREHTLQSLASGSSSVLTQPKGGELAIAATRYWHAQVRNDDPEVWLGMAAQQLEQQEQEQSASLAAVAQLGQEISAFIEQHQDETLSYVSYLPSLVRVAPQVLLLGDMNVYSESKLAARGEASASLAGTVAGSKHGEEAWQSATLALLASGWEEDALRRLAQRQLQAELGPLGLVSIGSRICLRPLPELDSRLLGNLPSSLAQARDQARSSADLELQLSVRHELALYLWNQPQMTLAQYYASRVLEPTWLAELEPSLREFYHACYAQLRDELIHADQEFYFERRIHPALQVWWEEQVLDNQQLGSQPQLHQLRVQQRIARPSQLGAIVQELASEVKRGTSLPSHFPLDYPSSMGLTCWWFAQVRSYYPYLHILRKELEREGELASSSPSSAEASTRGMVDSQSEAYRHHQATTLQAQRFWALNSHLPLFQEQSNALTVMSGLDFTRYLRLFYADYELGTGYQGADLGLAYYSNLEPLWLEGQYYDLNWYQPTWVELFWSTTHPELQYHRLSLLETALRGCEAEPVPECGVPSLASLLWNYISAGAQALRCGVRGTLSQPTWLSNFSLAYPNQIGTFTREPDTTYMLLEPTSFSHKWEGQNLLLELALGVGRYQRPTWHLPAPSEVVAGSAALGKLLAAATLVQRQQLTSYYGLRWSQRLTPTSAEPRSYACEIYATLDLGREALASRWITDIEVTEE